MRVGHSHCCSSPCVCVVWFEVGLTILPRNTSFSCAYYVSADWTCTNSHTRTCCPKQSTASRRPGRDEIPQFQADNHLRPVFSRRLSPSSAAADRRPAFRPPEGKRVQPRDPRPPLVAPLPETRPHHTSCCKWRGRNCSPGLCLGSGACQVGSSCGFQVYPGCHKVARSSRRETRPSGILRDDFV